MPHEHVRFKPRKEILTFEEIERFVGVATRLGINRLRISGGEPLVRAGLHKLVAKLASNPDVRDLALTTNGVLLAEQAADLKRAGLQRLNISLDGLQEETFHRITRRSGLDRVLQGIFAAQRLGFERIRLNAVVVRGVTDHEIVPLAEFARQHDLQLRFIEFMPLDADRRWQSDQVVSAEEVRRVLERSLGPLIPERRADPSQPAIDYRFADGRGRIGFIHSVTRPFCGDCDRLRLTAEGQVRNCLFSAAEWDARAILRGGGTDLQLAELLSDCVKRKQPSHGIDSPEFARPQRAMYQIGG
jgi:cyclic pyranopterin phosphate synthase